MFPITPREGGGIVRGLKRKRPVLHYICNGGTRLTLPYWCWSATQLLVPSLCLLVFSSIIEGGAGIYKEFLDISMLHSVVIPTSLSVNKRLSNAERAKFELSVNSKEGQALIGNLLGDC